jgi:TonB family protein
LKLPALVSSRLEVNMKRALVMASMSALIAQSALAAPDVSKEEQSRQLHEMVFKSYPPRALAAGEEGPVFFRVKLDKDGAPMSCEVTRSSGHPLLDDETCSLIVQHAVFSGTKDANGHLIPETAEGVVNWTLPGHTPATVNLAPTVAAAPAKAERQVCKRKLKAGSLADYERTCMTPSEWAKQAEVMKQVYADMQGSKGASVCANPGNNSPGTENGISAAPPPGC